MKKPFCVEVLSGEDENLAGFSWGFSIWVALRKTNRYSVGASYHTNEPPAPAFRTFYPLQTAAQIWDAIDELHSAINDEGTPITFDDARLACSKLADVDPAMAAALLIAAASQFE